MLASFRKRYINVSNTEELISNVEDLLALPTDTYEIVNVTGSVKKFTATINCKSIDVIEFVNSLKDKSDVTIRERTEKVSKNEYTKQKYFRCQHNTRYQPTMPVQGVLQKKPSSRIKSTNCPFSLVLKYKANVSDEFPVVLQVDWEHNHPISSLHSLSFKDIPDEVSLSIKELFENGYTPAHAYREFLRMKREESKSQTELLITMSDRSKVPRRNDYNNIYVQ